MKITRRAIGVAAVLVLVLGLAAAVLLVRPDFIRSTRFVEHPFPLTETYRFYDVGVVDANGDKMLDVYTSNHHFRQSLLIADGRGGYRDVLSDWGLDQSHDFPLAELSFSVPEVDKAGVYIYWRGSDVIVRAHRTAEVGAWSGSLLVHDPVRIVKSEGFAVTPREKKGLVTETEIEFAPSADRTLVLRPGGQGLPVYFNLRGDIRPDQIYVGLGKVTPRETKFVLAMQDRHGMAWADINGDGALDVFITRGALAGTFRAYPEYIQRQIKDELFVSQGNGKFADVTVEAGIEKRGCSGRHVTWVDIDQDDVLDLFVNCYDRGAVAGIYPKQLYLQEAPGRFRDVAAHVGLDLPDRQFGSFLWLDVDGDGRVDLVTLEDEGIFLYRNRDGKFHQEPVQRRAPSEADSVPDAERIGRATASRWFYDGKLTAADYDADGNVDVFLASQRGNMLLRNDGRTLTSIDLAAARLPARSLTANWVDYDNDGLPDLHLLPQGVMRQRADHTFEATDLLAFSDDQYQAAIANWFDLDNDGRRDVLMALDRDPSYDRWWRRSPAPKHREEWLLRTFRNTGAVGHWLEIDLQGAAGNRQGIGARVTVVTTDGRQVQDVGASEGAFFSQGHYRLYFGLGRHATATRVAVRWSDGHRQELSDVAADRLLAIRREAATDEHAGRR